MSPKKYFYVLTGGFILTVLLIIGGAVGGNSILQKQSKRLSDLKVENAAIEMQQTALLQAKKDVEKYSELESIVKSVVPQDKDQAKTVREIVQIAANNNIPVKSITFESSTLGTIAPKAATPSADADKSAAPKPAQPTVSQVKPVEGIPGVFTLPVKVESAGKVSYQDFLKFMESLEKNRRTAHVDAISLEPSENGKNVTFNITLNAYVKP